MTSLKEIVSDLRNQMMDQMRARLPQSYFIMMDSMRRFPKWLYQYLVASPTKGALASYFYSDTGQSLMGLDRFAGCYVLDATHYPPNSAFPGLTIIFMRFKGCQKIIFAYPDMENMKDKMDKFESVLKRNLLGFD